MGSITTFSKDGLHLVVWEKSTGTLVRHSLVETVVDGARRDQVPALSDVSLIQGADLAQIAEVVSGYELARDRSVAAIGRQLRAERLASLRQRAEPGSLVDWLAADLEQRGIFPGITATRLESVRSFHQVERRQTQEFLCRTAPDDWRTQASVGLAQWRTSKGKSKPLANCLFEQGLSRIRRAVDLGGREAVDWIADEQRRYAQTMFPKRPDAATAAQVDLSTTCYNLTLPDLDSPPELSTEEVCSRIPRRPDGLVALERTPGILWDVRGLARVGATNYL